MPGNYGRQAMTSEHRIFGPPGTGKTTYLTRQIESAVGVYGASNVAVASFTTTAAKELAGRNQTLPDENIGTLHSHCFRAIGHKEVAENHLPDWNADFPHYALSGGVNPEDPLTEIQGEGGNRLFSSVQILRARMVPPEEWPAAETAFHEDWTEWKEQNDLLDFTDMIEIALRDVDVMPGNPVIGIFDESQDFTALEMAVIRKWSQHMKKALIALDDDQCLYAFKGAAPDTLIGEHPNNRILKQSYRVPAAIHEYSLDWIKNVSKRQVKEYLPKEGDPGEIRHSNASFRNPAEILDEIENHIKNGGTCMIIASSGYMVQEVVRLLKERAIPFHNPYSPRRGDWNPLRKAGKGEKTSTVRLLSYLRMSHDVWGDKCRVWNYGEVQQFADLLVAKGVFVHGGKKKFGEFAEQYPSALVDTGELLKYFEPEALHKMFDMDLGWFESHLLTNKESGMRYPLTIAGTHGGRLLHQEPGVVVGTIHSVKGAEADHVYVFPDLSMAAQREWIQPGLPQDSVYRLFYVAFTRARQTLTLCSPASRFHIL